MENYEKKYDVAIVGSGPAGSYLGHLLASRGISVLILEKDTLPRYKPCGGGLTRRVLDLLPFDLDQVVEDYTFRARIGLGSRLIAEKITSRPIIAMVMRDKFDFFLAARAEESGVLILKDTAFQSVSGSTGNLTVKTSGGIFHCRLLVGADGVHSRVARELGLWSSRTASPAFEAEVYCTGKGVMDRFRNAVHFDFGTIPKGYAWIFPKKDHLSVGVMSSRKKVPGMKNYFESYLKLKGLIEDVEIVSRRGHLIPLGPGKHRSFATPEGLLVGDAAGLADPITGEGIFHALRQAEIACGVICDSINSTSENLLQYNRYLHDEFVNEFRYAGILAGFFYGLQGLSHRLLKAHGDKITSYHLDIITGAKTYRELFFKALNPANLMLGSK